MYVIVVGGGAVGCRVAKMLEREGYAVTIIEKDRKRAEELYHETHAHIVIGDATNPRILESADIRKADYVIIVTGDDDTNLIVAMLAKHYGVDNIIIRIVKDVFRDIARMLGIYNIVNPAETVAIQIDAIIRGIKFIDFIKISSVDTHVEEIIVKESNFANKRLKQIYSMSKDKIHPLMVIRNDDILIPDDDLILKSGDKLLILRKRKRLPF